MKKKEIHQKGNFLDMIKKLYRKILDDDIVALASQLAYNLVLSFFPFLIFLLTIVGASNLNENIAIETLKAFVPSNSYELIRDTINEVFAIRTKNLIIISVILSLWTASSGFTAVIKGLNKAYEVKETRSFIKIKIVSIVSTIALAILIVFTLFLLVFGDLIGKFLLTRLPFDNAIIFAWDMLRYIILISMMIFIFAGLYHFIPSRKLGWSEVLPGAVVTTIGWMIAAYGFSYYINNFSNYSRLYGSLAAVFILMIWLFISSIILIFGGELNAVLAES